MYKSLFFFVTAVAWCTTHAQKLNIKEFDVQAQYLQLPVTGLAADVSTYELVVEADEKLLQQYGYSKDLIRNPIRLSGYHLVDAGGSVVIQISVHGVNVGKAELVTLEREDKNKNKYKEYHYTHDISVSAGWSIRDLNGNVIDNKPFSETEKHKTKAFASQDALRKYYSDNYPGGLNSAVRALLTQLVSRIEGNLNHQFGLSPKTAKVSFEHLNSKDHPDQAKFDKVKATVEKAFQAMQLTENAGFVSAIQPAIEFWTEQEMQYSAADKDQRKVNYACRYNLATAYYWADDLDQAAKYARLIEQGDVSSNTGKRLAEEITELKEKMKRLQRTSRHLALQMSDIEKTRVASAVEAQAALHATGDITKFEGFESKVAWTSSSVADPAFLYLKGGKQEAGYLIYEPWLSTPDFRRPRNLRFGQATGPDIVVTSLKYDLLDSLRVGDRMFEVKDMEIGTGILKIKMDNALVEKVTDNRRTGLVICYPPFEKSNLGSDEMEPSVLVWHKEKKAYFYPDGLAGFNKAMAKIVEDCDAAVNYLKQKSAASAKDLDFRLKPFPNTAEMVESLQLYDSCGS